MRFQTKAKKIIASFVIDIHKKRNEIMQKNSEKRI